MKRTIIIAPGWGEDARTFTTLILELKNYGYRVITVVHRSHDTRSVMYDRMITTISVLKQERVPGVQLILIGHSLGGIDVLSAASDSEGGVDHLILISPAGLVDPLSLPELIARFARKIRHDTPRMMRIAGLNTLKRPAVAFLEAKAAGTTRTMSLLVHYLAGGKTVNVIATTNDLLFYVDDFIRLCRLNRIEESLRVVPGLHDAVHLEPRSFAAIIHDLTRRALDGQDGDDIVRYPPQH
jgi:pimeloyl-ACP methyl ester carboxylesterase